MAERLKDKIAIITGAASGIGRVAAELFMSEGACVVIADLNAQAGAAAAQSIQTKHGSALFVQTDMTIPEQVQALAHQSVKTYGRVDILFNNAAVNHFGRVTDTTVQDWDRVMMVNVRSVFLGCKYVIPIMQSGGGGVIVNTASSAALVGLKNLAAYTASKGAVLQLTKNLALDYAQDHIRVNALCPGVTATDMTLGVITSSPDPVAARARYDAGRPMGRMANPLEIAQAALFLACDESSFMTGSFLLVDGGYCAE